MFMFFFTYICVNVHANYSAPKFVCFFLFFQLLLSAPQYQFCVFLFFLHRHAPHDEFQPLSIFMRVSAEA